MKRVLSQAGHDAENMLISALRTLTTIHALLFSLSNHGVVAKSSTHTSYPTASTCASQTLNYITATLPQQCLRTGWSSERVPGGEVRQEASLPESTVTALDSTITNAFTPASDLPKADNAEASSQLAETANVTIVSSSQNPTKSMSPSDYNGTNEETQSTTESDNDPLSDNANFLSFEDWKAQMLKKAGQSPEHVSGSGPESQRGEKRGEAGGISNALDTLGEEGEFEIEFGGFVAPDATASAVSLQDAQRSENSDHEEADEVKEDKPRKHTKEAGTTSKQRFNYASFDCAATVLKTNSGCKGANSILLENKDSYMLNTCSANNKFLIVELCNDILIDTIVLGNFEFFSSTFKGFRVSVSDRYPVKSDKWKEVGTFEARNTRGIQAFLVENGIIWARYLRIEFLSHYGREYYCPVSLLRVHGKTMMDDYRADVKAARGEDDNDDDEAEDEPVEKVVAEPLKESIIAEPKTTEASETESSEVTESPSPHWQDTPVIDKCPRKSLSSPLVQQSELFSSTCETSARFCNMATVHVIQHNSIADLNDSKSFNTSLTSMKDPQKTEPPNAEKPSVATKPDQSSASLPPDPPGPLNISSSSKGKDGPASTSSESSRLSPKPSSENPEATGSTKTKSEHGTVSANKIPSTAVPVTQDSFFKSVHKRLQRLEANSTLSLQYIEEQSRILREAFTKVEKRQLSKTSTFLETLNTTVLSELREFRLQYDQIWQSTVLELSSQREQSQREVTALSQRLSLLADEILWQKRMVYLQFGLILLCLGLVLFPRNQASGSFDLQSMVTKQSSSFARYLNLESPPRTPSRPSSRYGLFSRKTTHLRGTSQDTLSDDEALKAPDIEYQLPTPTPSSDGDDEEEHGQNSALDSPEADPLIRRAQSTPNLAKESDDLLGESETEPEPESEPGGGTQQQLEGNDNESPA